MNHSAFSIEIQDLAEKNFILSKPEENNWNISQTAREIDYL